MPRACSGLMRAMVPSGGSLVGDVDGAGGRVFRFNVWRGIVPCRLSQAEIENLHPPGISRPRAGHEDVRRLKVAVDNPSGVRADKPSATCTARSSSLLECPAHRDRLAVNEFHHQTVFLDVVKLADIWVVEGSYGPRFALEALGEFGLRNLYGDHAVEARVAGLAATSPIPPVPIKSRISYGPSFVPAARDILPEILSKLGRQWRRTQASFFIAVAAFGVGQRYLRHQPPTAGPVVLHERDADDTGLGLQPDTFGFGNHDRHRHLARWGRGGRN